MLVLAMWPTWVVGILIAGFVAICVILILAILIQRPAGGGLVGAFGSGAGSGQTAFGTKTGDALTIATITMFVIYLVGAIMLTHGVRSVALGPTASRPPGATIEQGVQAPGLTPVEQSPGDQPAEQPKDEAADRSADPAAETPSDTPAETPPGQPADSPTPPAGEPPQPK